MEERSGAEDSDRKVASSLACAGAERRAAARGRRWLSEHRRRCGRSVLRAEAEEGEEGPRDSVLEGARRMGPAAAELGVGRSRAEPRHCGVRCG